MIILQLHSSHGGTLSKQSGSKMWLFPVLWLHKQNILHMTAQGNYKKNNRKGPQKVSIYIETRQQSIYAIKEGGTSLMKVTYKMIFQSMQIPLPILFSVERVMFI